MGVRPDKAASARRRTGAASVRSIPWKWASPTRPASRFGCSKRCTGRCLSWCGARISTSIGPPTPRKSARTPSSAANATPIALSPVDRTKANNIYDHWGQSISFLEHSPDVSPFNSKFDAYLAGNTTLTADEMAGYKLFNGKGNCNSCHLDGRSTTLTPGQTDTGNTALVGASVHLLRLCQ